MMIMIFNLVHFLLIFFYCFSWIFYQSVYSFQFYPSNQIHDFYFFNNNNNNNKDNNIIADDNNKRTFIFALPLCFL